MKDTISYRLTENLEYLLRISLFRYVYLIYCLLKHYLYLYILKNEYKSISALLRYARIVSVIGKDNCPLFWINLVSNNILDNIKTDIGVNKILESYISSKESLSYQNEFKRLGLENQLRLKYPKQNDSPQRQGDLLVLKPFINKDEKGVVFIQYNDAIKKLVSIYDIKLMAKYYRFIIEPSTWGYQDPIFLFFLGLDTEVIIEAQYEEDFNFISSMGNNVYPIRLGAGDWVDPDVFQFHENIDKKYDVIMNASWLSLKRHELFFKSLSRIKNYIHKVAVIGYPIAGRTLNDIIRESTKYNVTHLIEFYERISPIEVAQILQQSKVSLMLSKREGANKALYESFFSNVPVILSISNIGVNRDHMNRYTGIFSSDEGLSQNILYMVMNYQSFSPRKWALKNTGYKISNIRLNEFLKEIAFNKGEAWTRDLFTKKNFTNAVYVNEEDRKEADIEIGIKLVNFTR